MTTSPLARPFPLMPAIPGVTLHVARAAYKTWDRCDLTFVTLDPNTVVAGVLTQSKCPSPEVEWCRAALTLGHARALVVNAGNSNAFTGSRGRAAVEAIAARTAAQLGCQPSDVFVASTGVIGVPLPIDKAEAGLDAAFAADPCGWEDAAATIMTTDTFTKGATTTAVIGDRTVSLVGIIKGSGMIAPDMATMLGFVFTDAAVEPGFLQAALSKANAPSFSCITVDSDTSTSDTVLAFATGKAGNATLADDDGLGLVFHQHPARAVFRRGRRRRVVGAVHNGATDHAADDAGREAADDRAVLPVAGGGGHGGDGEKTGQREGAGADRGQGRVNGHARTLLLVLSG